MVREEYDSSSSGSLVRWTCFILACAFGGAGVAFSQATSPMPPTAEVTYVAQDFSFTGPDRIPAGMTTVRIVNKGQDLHQVQFIKLPADKTAADFQAEIAANSSRLPRWVHRRGGPNSVVPGEEAVAIVNLEAGAYVVLCGIPDRHGRPHVALGMLKTVQVEESVQQNPAPQADLTLTLVDFGFDLSQPIKPGRHTIHVLNKGSQAHEVVLVKLAPGASVSTFMDSFLPGVPAVAAGKPIGGVVGLDRGRDGFFVADFAPGRYGLICFLPDLTTGAPHFTRGMMMDVTVQ